MGPMGGQLLAGIMGWQAAAGMMGPMGGQWRQAAPSSACRRLMTARCSFSCALPMASMCLIDARRALFSAITAWEAAPPFLEAAALSACCLSCCSCRQSKTLRTD